MIGWLIAIPLIRFIGMRKEYDLAQLDRTPAGHLQSVMVPQTSHEIFTCLEKLKEGRGGGGITRGLCKRISTYTRGMTKPSLIK
jgi:hypothetical protein